MSNTAPALEDLPEGTYRIPVHNLDRLQAKLATLSKRAIKLGKQPATLHIGERIQQTSWVWDEFEGKQVMQVREFYLCTVTGERPVLAGYSFIAAIEHAGEAGNILRAVPGESVPVEFRDSDPERCDHCHTRRKRRDTYVVRHDATSIYAQVGSTCLQDFLGGIAPAEACQLAQYLFSVHESMSLYERDGINCVETGYPIEDYLGIVAAVIAKQGWISRTAARDGFKTATADDAWHAIEPPKASCRTARYTCPLHYGIASNDAYKTTALAALEWGRDHFIDKDDLSDYEHNLGVVIKCEAVTRRQAGLAASLISTYQRMLGQQVQAEQRRKLGETSTHVGKIGQRIDLGTCTVTGKREIDSNYGVTTLLTFSDTSGNVIKWFASGYQDVLIGHTVTVTATIKAHGEYRGVLDTTITRAKLTQP